MRDWLFVEDNCFAVDYVLHHGELGEIYNVGAGNEEENITITNTILESLNKPSTLIKYVKDRPGHDKRYALSGEKMSKIGWRPPIDLEASLKKTVNALGDCGAYFGYMFKLF